MVELIKILTLAVVDSINPCAFAVMTMVLISILVSNPGKKNKVLLGGFVFTIAVFIGYFFYGLIIVQFFKSFVQFSSSIYPYLNKALALGAILLGIFNLKDYFYYKPGGFATEMPLKFRPKVKHLIKKVTNEKGAFVIGIFVTMFLLPCTIGPYIIAGGGLSKLNFIEVIFWLIIYNLVFIIPMILITLLVYFGISTTEKLDYWKERRVKYMHLIAGLLLTGLGIAMLTGLL